MNDAQRFREVITMLAPGTELRDGLDRVIRAHAGALVVLGYEDHIRRICSDGFEFDIDFSATRLRELCKMDGAVIIDPNKWRIRRANVQLLPDPSIPTTESGMRHRTAHRVAVQSGNPVIAVSHSLRAISLYLGNKRYVLEDPETLLTRASLAIDTLEKYRIRLNEVSDLLTTMEIDDMVTARDVALVVQRQEMVRRVGHEVSDMLIQLGEHGRLLKMQQSELMRGFAVNRSLLIRDYIPDEYSEEKIVNRLGELDDAELLDLSLVARIIGVSGMGSEILEIPLSARGLRMLARIPRLPAHIVEAITRRWGTLSELLEVSTEELMEIDGVGPGRAQIIHDSLEQVVENSALERITSHS